MKIGTGMGSGLCIAALLGCASNKPVAKVDDSGLSRLNEQQMRPVDDARIEEGRARDSVAKAKATEQESHARLEVARSEREVAGAQLKRAAAERDLLKGQYADRDSIGRADRDIAAAKSNIQATDLKLSYLQKMISVAETERKLAEAHVDTVAANTEVAKLKAMRAADAPQAASVNEGALDARLAEAQAKETQFKSAAAQVRSAAVDDYNKWQELDAQNRATGQSANGAVPQAEPMQPQQSEPTK